ncbi:hypothetical protein [Streptomyces rochei]|uniref:hypothetical protein n=1 Tax=Streptomyces rochei TaxID=1928 RepID=UPI003F4B2861
MPDLAQCSAPVQFVLVGVALFFGGRSAVGQQIGQVTGGGGERETEVGAQDVDAGLAQVVVGGIVGEASQGVDSTKADGWGIRTELVDGLGEALGVEPGGFPVSASLIDTLAAVGDDQSNKCAGPGYHAEGQLHQVEESLGVDASFGFQAASAEKVPAGVEHGSGDRKCSEEGQGEDEADVPQTQFSTVWGGSLPSVECHEDGDMTARSTVAEGDRDRFRLLAGLDATATISTRGQPPSQINPG